MGRQLKLKPRVAPFLVAGLVLPISAAFAFLGPFFGFLLAGLLATVVVVAAVLAGEAPPPAVARRHRTRRQTRGARDRSRGGREGLRPDVSGRR